MEGQKDRYCPAAALAPALPGPSHSGNPPSQTWQRTVLQTPVFMKKICKCFLLHFLSNQLVTVDQQSANTRLLHFWLYIGGTVTLRFRKSISRHNFQNTRKFYDNDFQYHRDVIYSV